MNHPRLGRAALATLAASAVALTAAPAAHAGPLTGCYRPTADRLLRVIPKAQSCLQGERRISWNNARDGGGAGQRGARGLQGPSGAKGDTGAAGAAGAAGAKGETGAAGAAGAKGDTGEQGLQGVQGAVGAPGAQGLPGAAGPQGPQGPQGNTVTGPQGPAGVQGPEGPQGPQGNTVTGPQGPAGENGAPGAPGEAGPPGSPGSPGSPGAPGAQGEDGAPGSGAIFSSDSAGPAVATTIAGGLTGTVTVLSPSGSNGVAGVSVVGGTISFGPTGDDPGQVIARNGTLTSVAAQIKVTTAQALVGSTVQPRVSIWKASTAGGSYAPIVGAEVGLAPTLTGVIAIGDVAEGITTGLSIPVVAGDRLLVVFSATATGISLINTVAARVKSSIAVS